MIEPLQLDYYRRAGYPRAGLYALVAALGFAVHVGAQYWSLRQDVERKEARLAAGSKRAVRPMAAPRVDEQEHAFARGTIERLSTPWRALFSALEAANTERVALLSIEPNAERRTVMLTGEARDYLATLTYLARLGEQEPLQKVHLVRHDTRRDAPRRPVVFTISAAWRDEE